MSNRRPVQNTEQPAKGEGEERVRRALEDGVIAHERSPGLDVGWSIADLASDLGCSPTHAARIIRKDHNVHLRAGQIPRLRPRIRAAVLAALALAPSAHRAVESHVRRISALTGRLNELLDHAMADGTLDDSERAALRAQIRAIIDAGSQGVDDLGDDAR